MLAKCKYCGKDIIGGKGDYWHVNGIYAYGDMKCADGKHLAYPKDETHVTQPSDLGKIVEALTSIDTISSAVGELKKGLNEVDKLLRPPTRAESPEEKKYNDFGDDISDLKNPKIVVIPDEWCGESSFAGTSSCAPTLHICNREPNPGHKHECSHGGACGYDWWGDERDDPEYSEYVKAKREYEKLKAKFEK